MGRLFYLASSGLVAAMVMPVVAQAQSATLMPGQGGLQVTVQGDVSLGDLAAAADAPASQTARRIEMPRHALPDGSLRHPPAGLPALEDVTPVAVVPSLKSSGFPGIYDGADAKAIGGELEPPDQGLAVNAGQVVEIVNNSIQIFTSAGKPVTKPVNNAKLFGTSTAESLGDPHAVFDATSQRWFIEELIYNGSTFTGFGVAVSTTSNPAGTYHVYKVNAGTSSISACGSSLCLPDYPQVGYDRNAFFIAADLFSNGSGSFVSTGLYALPKAALLAGKSFTYVRFLLPDFVVQPAIPAPGQAFDAANNGTEYFMTARNIDDGSSDVRVYAVTNTGAIGSKPTSLAAHFVNVKAEAYTATVPSTQPDVIGPYGKSQKATSAPKLDAGYNAFGGGVKYANSSLYGAVTSGAKDSKGLPRDVIAWFAIKPAATAGGVTAKIKSQGYVVPPTGYSLSYPSFALSKTGAGILGLSITNESKAVAGGYPSTGFVSFTGKAISGAVKVTGQGATSDDGFTGYTGAGPAAVGRWGDYGGGTVDAKTGAYYVGNEFIPDAAKFPRGKDANWGTYISEVH